MLDDCIDVVFRYLDMGSTNSSKYPVLAAKCGVLLKKNGRPKVYNLFGSTLGALQVCHCKKSVLGRDYRLEFCGEM